MADCCSTVVATTLQHSGSWNPYWKSYTLLVTLIPTVLLGTVLYSMIYSVVSAANCVVACTSSLLTLSLLLVTAISANVLPLFAMVSRRHPLFSERLRVAAFRSSSRQLLFFSYFRFFNSTCWPSNLVLTARDCRLSQRASSFCYGKSSAFVLFRMIASRRITFFELPTFILFILLLLPLNLLTF